MANRFLHNIFLTAAVIFLTFCITYSAAALEVTFKANAKVHTQEITLGDIATFDKDNDVSRSLASQLVAKTGDPGNQVVVNTIAVKQYLERNLQLPADISWNGYTSTQVLRESNLIGAEEITSYIDDYIAENSDILPEAELSFIPRTKIVPFHLPKGDIECEIVPSNPGIIKSSSLTLIFRVDGRVRKNMSVRGQLQAMAKVVTPTTSIRRGSTITADQITVKKLDISQVKDPIFLEKQVLGKIVRANLRKNRVITRSDVEMPPVVQRGELVKIYLKTGTIQLTATGIAKKSGQHGEMIRVKNTSSNKLIYCRVAGPGTVEVLL